MITILFASQSGDGRAFAAATMTESRKLRDVRPIAAARAPGELTHPLVVEALKQRGHSLQKRTRSEVCDELITVADILVSVGPTVEALVLPGMPTATWLVPEPSSKAQVEVMLDMISMGVDSILATASDIDPDKRLQRDPLQWPPMPTTDTLDPH